MLALTKMIIYAAVKLLNLVKCRLYAPLYNNVNIFGDTDITKFQGPCYIVFLSYILLLLSRKIFSSLHRGQRYQEPGYCNIGAQLYLQAVSPSLLENRDRLFQTLIYLVMKFNYK